MSDVDRQREYLTALFSLDAVWFWIIAIYAAAIVYNTMKRSN